MIMKIGVSTASFFPREECENAIEIIKDIGSDCAEVFLGSFYEYRPEFAKANEKRFGGIEISSVHAFSSNFEPQLFSSSRRVRGDGYYWLDQFLRSALALGAKKYSFHGYISRASDSRNIGYVSEYMRDICEFAARYGVDVCLENVSWCTYNRPGIFSEFKARCPNLSAVLDIKQARRSGYPVNMYIEDMSGSISHVHLSDVDKNGKMCLPGKGIYNFEEIFKRLKGAGFDGPAVIEVYGGDYTDYSEIKQSLEYLKEIAYKIN